MKEHTDIDKLIDQLAASTRSPCGKFSAEESYRILHNRVFARRKRIRMIRFASAAAAVILLSVLSWSIYNYMLPTRIMTVSTLAETKNIILPDGTTVALNRYTTFSYPQRFKGDNRDVTLSGEAYFEVAHDTEHPFIVQTESTDVQVLGTHFNVEAYERDTETRTTLLEGSVAVSDKGKSQRIILQPNETAVYNKETGEIEKITETNMKNEIAWRNGEILFDNLALKEIVRQLSNAFNTDITVTDTTLINYRMNASFRNAETLDEILQLLSAAGGFYYLNDGQTIRITK